MKYVATFIAGFIVGSVVEHLWSEWNKRPIETES